MFVCYIFYITQKSQLCIEFLLERSNDEITTCYCDFVMCLIMAYRLRRKNYRIQEIAMLGCAGSKQLDVIVLVNTKFMFFTCTMTARSCRKKKNKSCKSTKTTKEENCWKTEQKKITSRRFKKLLFGFLWKMFQRCNSPTLNLRVSRQSIFFIYMYIYVNMQY